VTAVREPIADEEPLVERAADLAESWLGSDQTVLDLAVETFKNLARTEATLEAVQARLSALEEKAAGGVNLADAYKGVWLPQSFGRGTLVTHDSGLWLAMRDAAPADTPGETPNWKLVVRRPK
jgi:hypothetical protein